MIDYKNIDPVRILIFVFAIFIVSIFVFNISKVNMTNAHNELVEKNQLALKYVNLKNDWKNKDFTIKTIDNLISVLGLKNVEKNVTEKSIKVNIKNISLANLEKFVNKVLNEKLNILKFSFSKNSLYLEVGI